MTGTGVDLVIIPIVTTIRLVAWLLLVAYAAAHPNWGSGRASAGKAPRAGRRSGRIPGTHPPHDVASDERQQPERGPAHHDQS